MLFVRKDIPSNLLTTEEKRVESFYVELNMRKTEWLINCSYNPHKNNISDHLDRLSENLDTFSKNYEKMIILGDFNFEAKEHHIKSFC